jgi:hypothetical protein
MPMPMSLVTITRQGQGQADSIVEAASKNRIQRQSNMEKCTEIRFAGLEWDHLPEVVVRRMQERGIHTAHGVDGKLCGKTELQGHPSDWFAEFDEQGLLAVMVWIAFTDDADYWDERDDFIRLLSEKYGEPKHEDSSYVVWQCFGPNGESHLSLSVDDDDYEGIFLNYSSTRKLKAMREDAQVKVDAQRRHSKELL